MALTYAAIAAAVLRVAQAHPARRYARSADLPPGTGTGCSYLTGLDWDTHEPCGCIVGGALEGLGVPEAKLREVEGETPACIAFALALDLPHHLGASRVKVDDPIAHWLETVQRNQDAGYHWGHAVTAAGPVPASL